MEFIGEILPVNGYFVVMKDNPPVNYAKSLTHLYQPLIGMHAITLYQTLLHEIELQNEATLQTHHTLMNYLNIPLNDIYKARLKLEGIGLLRTYESKSDGNKFYTYDLQCPFAPANFFKDAMLTELLYHHIGATKYELLKSHFQYPSNDQQGQNVTASFRDVYQTFQPSEFTQVEQPADSEEADIQLINPIDFSWIEMMLKQRMIPVQNILTMKNKKLISEMMFLYDLGTHEVEKSVLWALTDENILDIEEFKIACHDIFKTKHHETPIELNAKEKKKSTFVNEEPVTKEDQLIQQFETISPKKLLEDLSSGGQASEREMKIIREVMTGQGLPAPVMNVLVHYVLIQSNMKLSKAYLETIASHWSRANLQNAKEAMTFAKKEIEKYKESKATRGNNNQASTEIIPDWFEDRNKKQQPKKDKQADPKSENERRELAALIKEFAREE